LIAKNSFSPSKNAFCNTKPISSVREITGVIGSITLVTVLILSKYWELDYIQTMALALMGISATMILSTLLIEKAHKNLSTGLDFSLPPRDKSLLMRISITKFLGLGGTFILCGCSYILLKTYTSPIYAEYFIFASIIVPIIWILSPAYIAFTTRYMIDPYDGLWHFGRLICLDFKVDYEKIQEYLLGWTVKAFFLAFMGSILSGCIIQFLLSDPLNALKHPVKGILFLVQTTLLFDVCFGTVGYILTFKLLDSHVRSTNPLLSAWVAALACYPPFALSSSSGPLNYHNATQEWFIWLHTHDLLLMIWGSIILFLAIIYAWATIAFGIRFSNLTHRGIITNGPYRWSRHPAYISKNLMWWMVYMPFLSTTNSMEAIRNCTCLLLINGIYWARAKTEEKHLHTDVVYRKYSTWIDQYGLIARIEKIYLKRYFQIFNK
jgi:protein-S-isoprenylcysteine O-methyltransferase Ste14